MRIKSQWFRPGAQKSATEIAGAAAFIAFRIAQNALKQMRSAGYDLPPGAAYFAFLAEFVAFLTLCADRIAYARGDEAWRTEFTTAMAHRIGDYLADNESDLLGEATREDYKRRFIDLFNERSGDYAEFQWTSEGPEYGFMRCFGHCVAETMQAHDRTWAVSQVIECEAPEAVGLLERAIAGLLDPAPRRRARGDGAARGE
jgi:hypothetical protein